MYGEWREKLAHADIFMAHCGHQALYCDKLKYLDRSQENVLKVVSVLCVARTPSKGITNGRINTLPLYNCTEGSPSTFQQARVVRYPCGREENMAMYHYTKSTRSQSLTVVERTISDLRA